MNHGFLKQYVRKKDNDNGCITVGIRNSCRHKEFLYTLSKNQNYLLKSYYKSYCRILRRVIREAKRLHYNRLIESAEDTVKTTWSIINRETGQKINNIDSLPKSCQLNTAKVNTGEAAHNFNKYFSSITENLDITKTNTHAAMKYLYAYLPNGFPVLNCNLVTEDEIISAVNKLKSKNSSGYDDITNKLIKLSRQQVSKPLAYITNK
jgi:hypothetical protein